MYGSCSTVWAVYIILKVYLSSSSQKVIKETLTLLGDFCVIFRMKRLWLILFILFSSLLFANEKTFIREYTYKASDNESVTSVRANALIQISTILREEVSDYIKSEYETIEEWSEKELIKVIISVTKIEIVDEEWGGKGLKSEYWIKAKTTLDLDDTFVLTYGGYSFEKIGDTKTAIQYYEKAIELDTDYTFTYNSLGNIFLRQDNYNRAIELYEKSREIGQNNAIANENLSIAFFKQGIEYNKQGNQAKAIQSYEQAIELYPGYINAYFNLGNIFLRQDNYTRAIELYEKSREINPNRYSYGGLNNAIANENLSTAYLKQGIEYNKQGNYTKAIEFYEKAIELDPDDINSYINLGHIFLQQENYTKAIEFYEKAIELDPGDSNSYINLGYIYSVQGKKELQVRNYRKAARLGHKGIQDWLKKNDYEW